LEPVIIVLIAGSADSSCIVQVMLISAGQNPSDVHLAMEATLSLSTGGPRIATEGSDGGTIKLSGTICS